MNQSTRKRLEAAGARVTTVQDFLGLSEADMAFIEMKIALAKLLRECRRSADLTQEQAAKLVGSSQSRVAKMEAGDPAVSMDLLVGSLLKLGASPRVVGKRIERVEVSKRPQAVEKLRKGEPATRRTRGKARGEGTRRAKTA